MYCTTNKEYKVHYTFRAAEFCFCAVQTILVNSLNSKIALTFGKPMKKLKQTNFPRILRNFSQLPNVNSNLHFRDIN